MGLWFRKDISRTEYEIDKALASRFGVCTSESFHYIKVTVGDYPGVAEYLRKRGYLRVDEPLEPAPSPKRQS